jgi:uncharacterized protein
MAAFENHNRNNVVLLKKTLVIGASLKPSRYSNTAVRMLANSAYPVIAIGSVAGKIGNIEVQTELTEATDVHTVTLYINAKKQNEYASLLIENIKPQRIIFNPGAENNELKKLAIANEIEVVENCTLNMLANEFF